MYSTGLVVRSATARGYFAAIVSLLTTSIAFAQGFPQDNVNTAGPTPAGWLDAGNPLKQMNEPDCAVAPGQPNIVSCGMNDYSGVDPGSLDVPGDPAAMRSVGDSWLGVAFSRDFARRFVRGIHPCHPADASCSIGQSFMADPNLSTIPGALFVSGIAGDRDGAHPGGVYMATWLLNNAETGPPYDFHRMDLLEQGTDGPGGGGRFLDKPGQDESMAPPGTPGVVFQVPDPNDPSSTVPVTLPAGAIHFVYAVFTGNDNNAGTKIVYKRFDDWDFSNATLTTKITEGSEINQGAYVSSRDFGRDNLIVWRRFEDNNELASIMFVTCDRTKCSKPRVLADFCPIDQPTGRARPRMLSLPVATHTGADGKWYVFYADRGDGNMTCLDEVGVPNLNASGVEARLDYSRIMMATWDGRGNANWEIQPVDPQLVDPSDPSSRKIKGHQVWPAATAFNGVVQAVWHDTRDSRLYPLIANSPLAGYFDSTANFGIDRFIEDYVLADGILRPARAYEFDDTLPAGTPFRHSIDARGRQLDASGFLGDSVKISRYPIGISPFTGNVEQLMHSFTGPRMFQQGSRPFYGDYNSATTVPFVMNQEGDWVEAEGPAPPGTFVQAPVFYAGFADNRLVRGDVYYDGCNESADDCSNPYEIPNQNTPPTPEAALLPLEGEEDPSLPPQVCTPGNPKALSRNQKVFVAAIRPGLAMSVVSARKPENPDQDRTFVLYVQNSSPTATTVNLSVPESAPARWNRDPLDPTVTDIDVFIPSKAGAVRTLFVDGDPDGIVVTLNNLFGPEILQALLNNAVDIPLKDFEGVLNEETYTLNFLGGRVVSTNFQDLENQDLENTIFLQDLENQTLLQDLENASILQDLENQDLENLLYEAQDLENNVLAQQDLENQALLFQDLENQDLENQDLENDGFDAQDLENKSILFQDLENQDLENGALGDQPYVEISWPIDTESNTTVGVNTRLLGIDGATDGLTTQVFVTQTYLTHTVAQSVDADAGQFCTPQVVADNQVVYNEINPVVATDTSDPGLAPDVITFFAEPGVPTTVTFRVYGDIDFDPNQIGLAVYAQAGDIPQCSPEVGGDPDLIPGCAIDFAPDETPPEITGLPSDPPPGSPFALIDVTDTTFRFEWTGVTANDEVDGDVEVSCSYVDGDGNTVAVPRLDPDPDPFGFGLDFPLGDTIVTCTAVDNAGNVATASFTVSVIDDLPPELVAPPDLDVSATGQFTPVDIGEATATDAFLDEVTFDASGTTREPDGALLFPIGTTIVTWTATDSNGNTATAIQSVTVVDDPPDFSVVQSCTIVTTDPAGVAVADWATECPDSFTATDLVDGSNVTVDCMPDTLALGEHDVDCTATDSVGNTTAPLPLAVSVVYAYTVEIDPVKGNKSAGSTIPLDFRYRDALTGEVVDSSGFAPVIIWRGPFSRPNCGGINLDTDSGMDAGNSSYRLTGNTWQFSWQTPSTPGSYLVSADPPGNGEPFLCVTLK